MEMQEIPEIKTLLKSYYQTHSLVLLENIGYKGNYFVYKENNEIIAGLQANPVLWNIIKIDGLLGKTIKIISHIPFLNRVLNTKYKFLAIEGVYLKEGYFQSDVLYTLLESVLAHFKYNTALLQLDSADRLALKIEKEKKLGLINKISNSVTTHLMVKISDECQTVKPVYISSFDFA